MKLVKKDILHIDAWLKKRGIKFIDIRYELMDHLISEYESIENYPDLESFLKERLAWCKKVAKEKQKTIHWNYQKEVWVQLYTLFKKPKSLISMFIITVIYYWLYILLAPITFKGILIASFFCLLLFQFYRMIFFGIKLKKREELSSITYLMQVFALPQLFAQGLVIFNIESFDRLNFITVYIIIAILINTAALLTFENKRKQILKEYEFLKVYLE